MWSTKVITTSILLLLRFLTISACADNGFPETTQFEEYIGIFDRLYTVADKLRIAQAIWGEIQLNEDLEQAEILLSTIHDRLLEHDFGDQITKSQRKEIKEIHADVRAEVIEQNSALLAQVTFDSAFARDLKSRFDYDVETRRKIFRNAIDLRYGLVDASKMALEFYVMNAFHMDREFLIDTELYLYWKLQHNHDIDEKLKLLAGYFISEMSAWNLTSVEHRRFNEVISALPSSVQHLYGTPNKCVLNAAHQEFLYHPLDILVDQRRSFVFTWHKNQNSVGGNGVWNVEVFPDLVFSRDDKEGIDIEDAILTVKLTNVLKQNVLYRDDELQYNIMAADTNIENSGKNLQKNWRLVLNDNKIIFKQDDGVSLCASDSLHDDSRRFVQALKVEDDDDERCAWYITQCPI